MLAQKVAVWLIFRRTRLLLSGNCPAKDCSESNMRQCSLTLVKLDFKHQTSGRTLPILHMEKLRFQKRRQQARISEGTRRNLILVLFIEFQRV